uniref:Uncharacterized protein n=1 Tax=Oryza brachyantha TaxID=4533 RepID=J3LCL7_ORYBR
MCHLADCLLHSIKQLIEIEGKSTSSSWARGVRTIYGTSPVYLYESCLFLTFDTC